MPTPHGPAGTSPGQLINPRERVYYAPMVVVSLLVYGGLIFAGLSNPEAGADILVYVFYALLFALLSVFAQGLALGRVRGNAVRVSERQFPQQGEAAVSFIMGHELAHIWRGHLKHRWLTLPGRLVPYLGAAYSRACEYTCDRIGAFCQPEGAISGLLALAAGKQLHAHVDVKEYAAQAETERDFWTKRVELMSTHPLLPKRVAALLKAGIAAPTRSQWSISQTAAAA
jgi:Zn-dependent protease with chaperone function